MSGTRKLGRFEGSEGAARFESGTQKLERFPVPGPLSIPTPIAEISPATLAASRPSSKPIAHEEPVIIAADLESEPLEADDAVEGPPSARNADREQGVEQLRTRLARKFTTIADRVTEGFAEFTIGAGGWVVELTAPEGMSTGGGKQVLQHLRLRPTRQGYVAFVGGVVNAVNKTAELRDHAHMDTISWARLGQGLEITAGEWEQFLRKAEMVLRQQGMHTTRVAVSRDTLALARKSASAARSRRAAMIVLGIVSASAAVVAWRVLVALWP